MFKYELLAFNSIAFVLGILIVTYLLRVGLYIALGLITEDFPYFHLIFFALWNSFFSSSSDDQEKKNARKKAQKNLTHFHFFAFILQETHEIVAIKKFKDSEGNLFSCMILNVSNYIVNVYPVKMRSLI